MPTPNSHALLSPSSAHRWLKCTAAPLFEQNFPSGTSAYAEEGTLAHTDNLFLLSLTQVLGKGFWSDKEPEDSQLDIFKTERDRVKLCDGYTSWWWLRSAYGTYGFYYVGSSGNNGYNSASASGGVVLGFCI